MCKIAKNSRANKSLRDCFRYNLKKSFPNTTMKNIFKVLLLSLFIVGCESDDPSAGSTFNIYLDYWNTTGRNPEIRFNEQKSSKEIKIDFNQTFEGQAEGTLYSKVIIDNFKILDRDNNNYTIQNIKAYEYRGDNVWKEDVEFKVQYTQTTDVGEMVLVLDRSESLGTDFERIKQYAAEFVEQTFASHPEVKIGVVDFSAYPSSLPITNNKEVILNYIKNLEMENFTALYDAMDMGVDMLLRSASQSRILVTFTDGTDNFSRATLNDVLSKINSDKNLNKIRGFFIGLAGKGDLDTSVPTLLSSKGWIVSVPQSATQVKEVFNKFGRLISNVYHLTYVRNQKIIPRNTPIVLRFDIQATK
jgi:Ca-activated chloride channel family protein